MDESTLDKREEELRANNGEARQTWAEEQDVKVSPIRVFFFLSFFSSFLIMQAESCPKVRTYV